MIPTLIGAGFGLLNTAINNDLAAGRTAWDRQQNYMYGEMSAENADKRTRALYNDIYSPKALLQQYLDAGLSPSLMFGGTPGQGGMSGAQGNGGAGLQTPFMPISAIEAATIGKTIAETQKTKAETKNIEQDTVLKELEEQWNDMRNKEKSIEFDLTTTFIYNEEGKPTSLYELATTCSDYDKFIELARKYAENTGDPKYTLKIGTEQGQKVMRQIYLNANKFERDIKVLSEEGVNADFQRKLMETLDSKGYAELNADAAIKQLRAVGEAADLTKEQKESFNNILERLRKSNSTTADIIVVISMILNNAASNWGTTFRAMGGGK